jgi:hypothetical protein
VLVVDLGDADEFHRQAIERLGRAGAPSSRARLLNDKGFAARVVKSTHTSICSPTTCSELPSAQPEHAAQLNAAATSVGA